MMPELWIWIVSAWLLSSLVLTIAIALAARIGLAPVLDAAARLRHGPGADSRFAALEARCARLEHHLAVLSPQPERTVGRSA